MAASLETRILAVWERAFSEEKSTVKTFARATIHILYCPVVSDEVPHYSNFKTFAMKIQDFIKPAFVLKLFCIQYSILNITDSKQKWKHYA